MSGRDPNLARAEGGYTVATRAKLKELWMYSPWAGPSERFDAERSFDALFNRVDEALAEKLRDSGPVPGIRPYRLATVDELIDAYEAYDGDLGFFITAWNDYTAGHDFPCPESEDGIHYVTDGSCDGCGDKNREDTDR